MTRQTAGAVAGWVWAVAIATARDGEAAFSKLEAAPPATVIAALTSDDRLIRDFALARIAREDPSPALTRAAADALAGLKSPRTRAQLIAVLAERGDLAAAPAVRAALGDPDREVRAAAVEAAGLLKDAPAADALFAMLGNDLDSEILDALRRLPDPAMDARLLRIAQGDEIGMPRAAALELLAARRHPRMFDVAMKTDWLTSGDPALARAAATAIRTYAPTGAFSFVLAFALALPAQQADLLVGTLSLLLAEDPDLQANERSVGRALAACGPEHAPMLTGLLAASQGPDALAMLARRLESEDVETRRDAMRNLGKWNSEKALTPLVLAARREADIGVQTLAWRMALDVARRPERIEDFYQAVSAIQQAIWHAPRREEQVAALEALPLYHPKAWEVAWLLDKVKAEKPDLAIEAGRIKASLDLRP